MAKKRKVKPKVKRFLLLIIIIIILVVSYSYYVNNHKKNKAPEVKTVDTIKDYDYVLSNNATKYYKKLFNELNDILKNENLDENEYAKKISQMFVADFFNLDNKTSKNDVGGTQFVYQKYKNDFVSFAKETMYKTVESNLDGDRKQELPIVSEVEVTLKNNETFKYNKKTDESAYVITFNIIYKKDLGYQNSGVLTLIHNDNKLELAKME